MKKLEVRSRVVRKGDGWSESDLDNFYETFRRLSDPPVSLKSATGFRTVLDPRCPLQVSR